MLKNSNIKKLNQRGFSLLEVMIAITIITAGILGVFGLIVKTIAVDSISNNEVIASNLAQEGIEVVRNIRDTNWLEGKDFDWKIEGVLTGKNYIPKISGGGDPSSEWKLFSGGVDGIGHSKYQVYYDIAGKFYTQNNTGTEAPYDFHRLIKITEVDINGSDYYLRVECQVRWTERGKNHIITVEDRLFDWK